MEKKELNRIKAVLKDQGRKNLWLAEKMGKTPLTVSRWCRNVQQPDLNTLYKIAALLDVHVCTLLTDDFPERE